MRKLFGGILLAVGLLIAGASGLCSFLVLLSAIGSGLMSDLGMVLMFGGVPFLIGLGLFFAGQRLIRSANEDNRAD